MQLAFRLVRAARRLSSVEAWLGCGWLVFMAVLEIAGQRFTSDFADAAALLGVSVLVYMTRMVHRRRNLRFVTSIGMGLRFVSHAFWLSTVEIGVDLTRSPPLPRGIPLKWPLLLVILTLLVSGLIIVAPAFPSATRTVLAAHFYLACLVLEGMLWLVLVFGILVHSFLAWGRLHDWLVERHRDQQPRSIRTEVRATLAMFALLIGAAAVLPLWIPLAVHALFLVTACAALLASSPGLELVWRYRGGGSVRVFDGRWLVWMTCVGSGLFAIALIVIAGGESLWEGPLFLLLKAAPITTLLGRMFAWISIGGNFVAVYYAVLYAALGILFNARRFGNVRGPATAPEDRRSEIQSRREIVRRLQVLFRRAARQQGIRGTGLWIGLQHWFILGLSRDNDESEGFDRETTVFDDIIGPPYYQFFTSAARRHFQRITRALQVDLVFVENGVGFRRFVRVLRMMFEIYDVHGGRTRAEERHFTGLPGVRVLFHDFDLCDSPRHGRDHYPEPDYEHVGRARILHVFKDRGEAADDAPVPESWEGIPVATGL
jgi:hypothetical protein